MTLETPFPYQQTGASFLASMPHALLADEMGLGKSAQVIVACDLINANDINMQPVHDPVSTVVMQTSLANIDSVMIAGRWKKRHGQLLGVELPPLLQRLQASGQKITRALNLHA